MLMRIPTDDDFFRTSDFPLIVTASLSFPIESVDQTNPRRTVFLFRHCEELDDLVAAYHRRELRIEPQDFFLQSKAIKARIYAE